MPWATDQAADAEFQRRRIQDTLTCWDNGSLFLYALVVDGELVGTMGLHARVGVGGLEIGYWVRSDYTGRGIAGACAGALTSAALALPGISRVEIHCDEANLRSAAIPRRLGYRLDHIEAVEVTAPGETGRRMIWVFPRDTHPQVGRHIPT